MRPAPNARRIDVVRPATPRCRGRDRTVPDRCDRAAALTARRSFQSLSLLRPCGPDRGAPTLPRMPTPQFPPTAGLPCPPARVRAGDAVGAGCGSRA